VSGTPAHVADRLCRRNNFADRTTLLLYNETHPAAVVDIVRAMKETASS
jgi:hypothetical protein